MLNNGCPKCKSDNITYTTHHFEGEYVYFNATCDECKTKFKEWYELSFDGIETEV